MARPRIIHDIEVKDTRVRMGMSLWDRLMVKVNRGEASSVSALIREAIEEKYGSEHKG